nr:MAG TPA: hypothetical protein [Caudoviricetes sp.]
MRVLEKLFGGFQNSPLGESIFVIFLPVLGKCS